MPRFDRRVRRRAAARVRVTVAKAMPVAKKRQKFWGESLTKRAADAYDRPGSCHCQKIVLNHCADVGGVVVVAVCVADCAALCLAASRI